MCSKDCSKWWKSALAAVVTFTALEYVLHHWILSSSYQQPQYATLWNSMDAMSARRWWMFASFAVFGVAFAKIYTYGYEANKSAIWQGVRYGWWIGLITAVTHSMMEYMVYPIDWSLAWSWAVAGVIECVIAGVVVAWWYKPEAAHQHAH